MPTGKQALTLRNDKMVYLLTSRPKRKPIGAFRGRSIVLLNLCRVVYTAATVPKKC
jgi:hypothetical protein